MLKFKKLVKKIRSHLKSDEKAYKKEIVHNKEEIKEDEELRGSLKKVQVKTKTTKKKKKNG